MAILDKYLKPIADGRADELHMYANVPPTYLLEQRPVKELSQSLSNDDILSLLQEVIGDSGVADLNEKRRLNYQYDSPFGGFRCQLRWSDGDLKTRFTRTKTAANETPSPSLPSMSAPSLDGLHASSPSSQAMRGVPPTGVPLSQPVQPDPLAPRPAPSAATYSGMHAAAPAGPAHSQMNIGAVPHGSMHSMASLQGVGHLDFTKYSPEERQIVKTLFEHADGEKEIDRLFEMMLQQRSSDLHISSDEKPMLRVDGGVKRIDSIPVLDSEQVTQLLAPIIPQRNRVEFCETWDTDFAYEVEDVGRFRANIFRDRKGVGAVFRLIPSEVITAEQLGLPKVLRDLCYLSKGLVLVTGPTGSGKSTTLCALIDLINRSRDDHIITIEDPIEFVHPNKRCLVNQREVGVHTNSFKAALRAALREDPDIILVGELRDLETMAIAIETAETGHLVFGTLHTSSAISTVDRLIDQFPGERQQQIRMMLSNSLKGVISQTLLRKNGGGRIAAMEILIVTAGVANLVREAKIHQIQSIMQTNRAMGMQCLNDVLFDYVSRKVVDVKEAYTKAIDKKNFIDMLEEAGISTASLAQDA